MSIGAAVTSFEHDGRKVNMIDTPGEPSFVADTLAALRVVDSAVFVVNGVMGVEVHTERLWRARRRRGPGAAGVRQHARPRAGRLLPRPRVAQGRLRPARRRDRDPDRLRARDPRRDRPDRHDRLRVRGRGPRATRRQIEIPEELRAQAEEYREKLMDEVAENSDELMERYLEGEEISHDEIVAALKKGVTEGHLFPVTCGVATQNLGTNRLLEALVEDLPSPAMRGGGRARSAPTASRSRSSPTSRASCSLTSFKTTADPYTGRINMLRVYSGVLSSDSHAYNAIQRSKERIGQLSAPEGKEMTPIDELGPGDIGAVAKLRETRAGDVLAAKETPIRFRAARPAGAGDGVRLRAEVEGRRGEGGDRDPPALRGGPDARRAPRRRDRRADHRRADPGPRRGDRRPDQAPLRRRDRAASAAGALHRDDPQPGQGPRPLQEADRRPRASSATATSRSSRTSRGRDSSSSTRSRAA